MPIGRIESKLTGKERAALIKSRKNRKPGATWEDNDTKTVIATDAEWFGLKADYGFAGATVTNTKVGSEVTAVITHPDKSVWELTLVVSGNTVGGRLERLSD